MGRCPKYLKPDDFEALAESVNICLTDDGVSAIGEICEHVVTQILQKAAAAKHQAEALEFDSIVQAAEALGVKVESDRKNKSIQKATI
jgi:hypothetical protein